MSHLKKPGGPSANGMATKRIKKEIADLSKENLGSIILTPDEANIFKWTAKLPGPVGSPYEGGLFDVNIEIPADYPFSPPRLMFATKVYHCNISGSGGICLDLLKNAWSPALSLFKVILSLSSLLTDPNPADPLVPNIAQEYKRNRAQHDRTAREWTKLYAMPKTPAPAPIPPKSLAAPRPRIHARPSSSNSTATTSSLPPPPQIAGSRRTRAGPAVNGNGGTSSRTPIEIGDDSDHEGASSEVEAILSSSRDGASRSSRDTRSNKRIRINGTSATDHGGGGDEVIVIDD